MSLSDPKANGAARPSSIVARALRWALFGLFLTWLLLGCQVLFGGVTITTNDANADADAECNVGDSRCNGEYLLSCDSQDTGWALKGTCASGDLCDAKNKRCSVCKDGDFRCSGSERQQCAPDGSAWKTVETCPAENLCSESSCNGCKIDGQLDCSVAPQLRECKGGVWVVLDTCASQAVCEATTVYVPTAADAWNHKCLAPGCDTAGKYKCDGAILKRCPPDQSDWVVVDTCDNEALCTAAVTKVETATDPNAIAALDMCKPACLNPGVYMCNGTALQQCKLDQTGFDDIKVCPPDTECDPVAGDCGQLCTPGNFQCNGATLRKCGSNGHWADEAKCETSALCTVSTDGVTGSCRVSPCLDAQGKDHEYVCKGATLQKCKDDRTGYEDQEQCVSAPLCEADSARCNPPTCLVPNGYQCFGQDLKQCAADQTKWNAITSCPTGQFCNSGTNPGCLTACPANPVRCNGKVLEHCDATTGWTTQATCSTEDLCNCAITDPDGTGPKTNSCALGLYKDGCGNVLCGGTLAGYQCQGTELQKCQAGRNGWDNVADCGANNLCYPGEKPSYAAGYCLTCPTAGELYCMSSTLKVCSSDRRTWNTSQTCAISCVAVQNGQDYCAACKPNAAQCASNVLQTCPSDQKAWTNTTCNSAALCDATNKQCDVCTQNVCSGKVLQKCSNGGQTLQSQTCASVCDAANGQCDACSANSYWCDGAKLNHCSADGQSFTTAACGTPGCNAQTNVCNQCAVGDQKCSTDGKSALTCNAAQTAYDSAACTLGCNATSKVCNACAVGDKKCGTGTTVGSALVCNASQSGYNATACGTLGCNATSKVCNVCAVGDKMCGTGTTSGSALLCNASQSGYDATACGTPGCNSATSVCNKCPVGDAKCSADGKSLLTCNGAQTAYDTTSCALGCNATSKACNVCAVGDQKCSADGKSLLTCNSAQTAYDSAACTLGCNATSKACNVCAAGDIKCSADGKSSLACNSGQTAYNTTSCGTLGCNATSKVCNNCTAGDQKCSADGKSLLTCNNGQTGYDTAPCALGCTGGKCNAAPPPICTALSYQCAGTTALDLSQCSADGSAWNFVMTCTASCVATATTGTCDPPP